MHVLDDASVTDINAVKVLKDANLLNLPECLPLLRSAEGVTHGTDGGEEKYEGLEAIDLTGDDDYDVVNPPTDGTKGVMGKLGARYKQVTPRKRQASPVDCTSSSKRSRHSPRRMAKGIKISRRFPYSQDYHLMDEDPDDEICASV
jgi:hypothetical protein